MRIFDQRTQDGSRYFARWPQAAAWADLCDHVLLLPDAKIVRVLGEELARAWLDFRYCDYHFAIGSCDGLYRLFVRDPGCPDLILYQVGCHIESLLGAVA